MGINPYTGLESQVDGDSAAASATAPTTQAKPKPEQTPAPEQGGGDLLTDAFRGVVGGVRDAANNILQAPLAVGEALSTISPTNTNPEATKEAFRDIRSRLSLPEVEQNNSALGHAIRGITQFGLGFGVAGKIVPGLKALSAAGTMGRIAGAAVQGGVGDMLVSDPHAERLSNLVESAPWLQNPVTELLAAKPGDSDALGRFKAGIEGAVGGVLAEGVIMALGKGIKATAEAVKLRSAGKVAEADAIIAKEAPAMEKAVAEIGEGQIDIAINPNLRGEAEKLADQHGVVYQGQWDLGNGAKGPHEFRIDDPIFRDPTSAVPDHMPNITVDNLSELDSAITAKYKDFGFERPAGRINGNGSAPAEGAVPGSPNGSNVGAGKPGVAGNTPAEVLRETTLSADAVKEHLGMEAGDAIRRKLITLEEKEVDGVKTSGFKITEAGIKKAEDFIAANQATAKGAVSVTDAMAAHTETQVTQWKRIAGQAPELEGAINYDKIRSSDDVKQFMSELVKKAKTELPDVLGSYQSQKETKEIANWLGKDVTELYVNLHSMRMANEDLAAHLLAGKNLIRKTAQDAYGMAEKINNGVGTEQDFVLLSHMTDVLMSTMDHVSSIQTSAARATAAGRIRVTGGIDSKSFAKLLENVGGSDVVKALAARMRGTEGDIAGLIGVVKGTVSPLERVMAAHNFLWMNGILSGLKTTGTNIVTTGLNSGLMPGFRMVGGLMQEVLGGEGGMRQFKEGLYQYKYFVQSFRDSLSWARKSFLANSSMLDQASNPLANVGTHLNPLSMEFMFPKASQGIDEGLRTVLNFPGNVVGAPGRFLTAQDELFKQLTYRTHVMAQAHVEAVAQNLEGDALKAFVNDALQKSVNQAGKALDEGALDAAKAATFTQSLANASWRGEGKRTIPEAIGTFAQSHPLIRGTILPFVKVPTNLMRQAIDMTPLGLARAQVIQDIKGGGEAGAMALGKMGAGIAFWGSAVAATMSGRLTGAGPSDPVLRAQLGPDWKPYSFVWQGSDGRNTYLSFERGDPFGMFFGLAADYAEMSGHMQGAEQETFATHAVTSILHNLSSKTYLRGITDVMDAISSADEDKLAKYLKARAASYVPGVFQVMNPDDEIKETRAGSTLTQMLSAVKSRVPGWSTTVEARRDNFGDKVMSPMGYPYTAINPFTYYRGTEDPVRKELVELAKIDPAGARFPLPNPIMLGPKDQQIDLRLIKNDKGQSAYDRWMELHSEHTIGGKTLHDAVQSTMDSSVYQKYRGVLKESANTGLYPGNEAVDLLRQKFDLYKEVTWRELNKQGEFPGLQKAKQEFDLGKTKAKFRGPEAASTIDQLRAIANQK